jgi:hypothetical protein
VVVTATAFLVTPYRLLRHVIVFNPFHINPFRDSKIIHAAFARLRASRDAARIRSFGTEHHFEVAERHCLLHAADVWEEVAEQGLNRL